MRSADLATVARVRAELRSGAAAQARESAGVSRAEVAGVMGVTRQTVWAMETGRQVPSAINALAYAKALAAVSAQAA